MLQIVIREAVPIAIVFRNPPGAPILRYLSFAVGSKWSCLLTFRRRTRPLDGKSAGFDSDGQYPMCNKTSTAKATTPMRLRARFIDGADVRPLHAAPRTAKASTQMAARHACIFGCAQQCPIRRACFSDDFAIETPIPQDGLVSVAIISFSQARVKSRMDTRLY